MDYIYSYLNDDVASREMHGSETNTAVVTVNAATNTISVDVKPISPSMLNVAKPTESGSYILQETISEIGEVSYSWATLEDYNQEVTQAIANLTQQLEQEKQERIESVQTEANVRELADTQLRTEFTSEIAQEKQEREQAVSEEAQRTNSMINQLNDNVQSGFNTINNVLTTSINNINNAILNESTIREEQFDDTTFRIRDLNTRLGVEIGNRESWDNIIYANLSAKIENEKRERVEQDQDIKDSISAEANSRQEAFDELSNKISSEANRTDNMINQLNNNVQEGFNILNTVLTDSINTINGGIEEERQTRATADETLQSNIDAEANERKSVDQHLWDILPDNIIAGTPMQGMENANAINIVFSKYQKHGIGEDPSDAELVEVPNQAITLFPATQEVAGVLTAADKTKIDNIATDIETTVQAEANAREDADDALSERITSIEDTNVLQSQILGDGRIQTTINSPAGRTFDIDVIDISNASNDDRFTVTLNNNDSISAMLNDGTASVPLVFMSKWNKVEVGGSGAPLNLNSDDGTVTVNDTYTLLNNKDRDNLNNAIEAEETRATQAEANLQKAIDAEITRAEAKETELDTAIQSEVTARSTADTQIHEELDAIDTRVGNLEGKTTRLFYGDGTATEPTADGINTFVTTLPVEPPYAAPFEGIAVVVHRTDENTYHIWHYYSNTGAWQDDGVDTVSTFTNSIRGIIQGSTNDGYVAAENGLGKVSGWDTIKTDITSLQNNLTSNVSIINQNIANVINDLAANVIILGNAYTQANNAYAQANTAYTKANEAYDLASAANTLATNASTNITTHIANKSNPHDVTAEQVGLGNVDNTSDEDKPISTATACAIACVSACVAEVSGVVANVNTNLTTHVANVNNPHQVNKTQVGLGNVENIKQYSATNPPPYPVTSVADKTGAVTLGNITFTGIVSGSYNGATDVEINIPSIGGEVGPAAGFGTPTVTTTTGEPGTNASVTVTTNDSSPNTAKVFEFAFTIPRGANGTDGQDGQNGSDGQDGAPGANGYTWIPSVASNGVISWTSTQEGPGAKPPEMNIMGPTGPAISTNIATITFFDAASNKPKTIKFYVVDAADAGDYEIGVNDGTL